MNMVSLEVAQLVLPLMEFVIRWEMFSADDKLLARACLKHVGFDKDVYTKVDAFLDALDTPEEIE